MKSSDESLTLRDLIVIDVLTKSSKWTTNPGMEIGTIRSEYNELIKVASMDMKKVSKVTLGNTLINLRTRGFIESSNGQSTGGRPRFNWQLTKRGKGIANTFCGWYLA